MPFSQWILLVIPTPIFGMIIVGASIMLAVTTLLVVRAFISHHRLKQHNDVAGSIFATVGVLYAVLLAFVVVVVWESFDKASENVQKEANCLMDLYRDSTSLSPEFKYNLHVLLKDYAKKVTMDEWKTMERGEPSRAVTQTVTDMWESYSAYTPRNITEQIFFQESVRKLNELGESRRIRIMDSRTGIHPILWIVLIAGGIVTMSFISFFGAENLKAQVTMAILLATLVGLIIFTIAAMDYPFTGSISISSDVFKPVLSWAD